LIDLIQKHLPEVEQFRLETLNDNYDKKEEEDNINNIFDNKSEEMDIDFLNDNNDFILNDKKLKKSRTFQIFYNFEKVEKKSAEDKKEEINLKKDNNNIIKITKKKDINPNINNTNNEIIKNDVLKDQNNNDNIDDNDNEEDNKFQTLITYEKDKKDKEKEKRKTPDFINFIENDKFIYDDLKYLELLVKEKINRNNSNSNTNSNITEEKKINNKNINNKVAKINKISLNNEKKEKKEKIRIKKHKNSLQKSPKFTYTKPQLSYFKNKKLSSSYNQKKANRITSDSFKLYDDILIKENDDEKINNNKPIKMYYHENNISSINNKYNNDEEKENVKDSEDEGIINEINHVKNYYYKTIQNYELGESLKNNNNIFYQINTSNNFFINICNDNINNNNKNSCRQKVKFNNFIDKISTKENSDSNHKLYNKHD
jgi:hypothetical protein